MASRGHDHDALWAKLYELELQLAAYKLLRAARGEEDVGAYDAWEPAWEGACCRGSQYDAYMRRRDARRAAGAAAEPQAKGQQPRPRGTRAGGGRPSPLTLKCATRDTREVKRTPAAVSIPITPRKQHGALPRSRTVSSGAAAGGCHTRSQHHRRNSVAGVPTDFGEWATPRPFLRRGSGTGGATARLRAPRVHDLALSDVPGSSPRRPPQDHLTQVAAERHHRSVSELPFDTTAVMDSPRPVEFLPPHARARKRWGSAESAPPVIFSAAATNPHMDLAKGLRKLLSFVRKGKSTEHQHCPARSSGGERDSGGKPVKGWAAARACSVLDGPFDRASLEGHQFPMTRAVGTSG